MKILYLFCVVLVCFLATEPVAGSAEFDGTGHIDRIARGEVVIDDRLYSVVSNARFFSRGGEPIGMGSFAKGHFVGFILKEKGKKEIVSLWMQENPDK